MYRFLLLLFLLKTCFYVYSFLKLIFCCVCDVFIILSCSVVQVSTLFLSFFVNINKIISIHTSAFDSLYWLEQVVVFTIVPALLSSCLFLK